MCILISYSHGLLIKSREIYYMQCKKGNLQISVVAIAKSESSSIYNE